MGTWRAHPSPCATRAAPLTALTRLECGRPTAVGEDQAALDLAAWGDTAAGRGLPALRVLPVWSATGFTMDGEGGRR